MSKKKAKKRNKEKKKRERKLIELLNKCIITRNESFKF